MQAFYENFILYKKLWEYKYKEFTKDLTASDKEVIDFFSSYYNEFILKTNFFSYLLQKKMEEVKNKFYFAIYLKKLAVIEKTLQKAIREESDEQRKT